LASNILPEFASHGSGNDSIAGDQRVDEAGFSMIDVRQNADVSYETRRPLQRLQLLRSGLSHDSAASNASSCY
jgi:hypothetical protein